LLTERVVIKLDSYKGGLQQGALGKEIALNAAEQSKRKKPAVD